MTPTNTLNLQGFFKKKRDFFLNCLKGSNWTFTPSEGTYFQLLNYGKISHENEVAFAKRLTIEHGVASIPISVFYKDGRNQNYLRFCFAKENEELERAAEKLQKL